MDKIKLKPLLLLISVLFVFISITSVINKSRTTDELAHLVSGYYYLTTGRNILDIEQPVLRSVLSIPTILNNKLIAKQIPAHMNDNVFGDNLNTVLFMGRVINIFLTLFLSLIAFFIITKLTKSKIIGGVFLILSLFSPTLLAYSRFATPDVIGALTSFIAILISYFYIKNPSTKNTVILGLTCAVAFLTKYTAIVPLIYIFLIIFSYSLLKRSKQNFINLLVLAFVFLFIINLAFVFRGTLDPIKDFQFKTKSTINLVNNTFIGNIPSPLPREVVRGLDFVKWHTQESHYNKPTYFMGQFYEQGSKLYFPVLFLVKTPGLILILFFVSLIYLIKKIIGKNLSETEKFVILTGLLPFIIYFIFVVFFNKLNLGVRHILLIYLCTYLIIGLFIHNIYQTNKKIFKFLSLSILFYLVAINIQIYPHYLEYFNEFIGGPKNGYKYAIKSNLDWRQDANFIDEYKNKNNPNLLIDPQCGTNFSEGQIVALRANKLFSIENGSECYPNYKNGKLVDRVTYVWFIYEF